MKPGNRSSKSFQALYVVFALVMVALTWPAFGPDNWKRHLANATFCASLASLLSLVFFPRQARWFALAALVPVIVVLAAQCIDRLAFIAVHGAMDCFDCNGSPMAFLIGWIFEMAVLIPAAALFIWLISGHSHFAPNRQ